MKIEYLIFYRYSLTHLPRLANSLDAREIERLDQRYLYALIRELVVRVGKLLGPSGGELSSTYHRYSTQQACEPLLRDMNELQVLTTHRQDMDVWKPTGLIDCHSRSIWSIPFNLIRHVLLPSQ